MTQPVRRNDGSPRRDERTGRPLRRPAHVWHCSLSLPPGEGPLSDERWAAISEEFVARMGFADSASDTAPCRWVAIRHGESKAGNDHVHLVVGLVHEDGTAARTWNDRPRAQQVAGELERKHGLQGVSFHAAPTPTDRSLRVEVSVDVPLSDAPPVPAGAWRAYCASTGRAGSLGRPTADGTHEQQLDALLAILRNAWQAAQ